MKTKRLFALLVAVAMLAVAMVPAFAEEHDPVSLRFMWWGGDARAAATLDVIEAYETSPNMAATRVTRKS